MMVNTLQLLLLFFYHPADPGPEPDVVNDYRATVCAPRLTLPSCLTLTLQWCLNLGTDGLKSWWLLWLEQEAAVLLRVPPVPWVWRDAPQGRGSL